MLELIQGKVFVVGNNIDTDQIIPAEHLVYSMKHPEEKLNYGKYALSGLPNQNIPFVSKGNTSDYNIIIGGENFGCGSSREQAPAALMIAGVKVILVQSFARIFYRNVIDAAFFIPLQLKIANNDFFSTGDEATIDISKGIATNKNNGKILQFESLGDAKNILDAGGIFAYARKNNWYNAREKPDHFVSAVKM